MSADCGNATTDSNYAHMSIYSGAYDHTNLASHYLGDQAENSIAKTVGVDVVAGQTYIVVVNTTVGDAGIACTVGLKLSLPPETSIDTGPAGATNDPARSR